jgi:sulfur transfer protein SufE
MDAKINMLIEKRNASATELKDIKKELGEMIEATPLYKALIEHCEKSPKFQEKEAKKYCSNMVLKHYEAQLEDDGE